jgi:hypothetical protein
VREAANRAVQASVEADFDETVDLQAACEAGSRFVDASSEYVEALRTAFAPVVERLAADPVDGPILAELRAIAAMHPGPEPLDMPDSCREATAPQDAGVVVPDEVSGLPNGTYRVTITAGDLEAASISNDEGWTGVWTLTIEDGTYQMSCRAVENPVKDCGGSSTYEGALEAGYVRGTGNVVHFVYDAEMHSALTGCTTTPEVLPPCHPLPTYSVTWSLDGDLLAFSDSQPFVVYDKVLEPWTRIG